MGFLAVVLAAGRGKRMRSAIPKVLHRVAGRPLVHYPIVASLDAGAEEVVVVVSADARSAIERHAAEALSGRRVRTVVQAEPRGTGDAARTALDAVESASDRVLILGGDTPLVRPADLRSLLDALASEKAALALLSAELDDPRGYGRVLRDASGGVTCVREDRDLSPEARQELHEVNAGIYAARADALRAGLATLTTDNAQGEYYLTDVVAFAVGRGGAIAVKGSGDALVGVNDRAQLSFVEESVFARVAERHRHAGVTVRGTARIDDAVTIGEDALIESNVHLRGRTTIEAGAVVDTGSVVVDSTIGAAAVLKPYSIVTESSVGARARIGPFANLRPGSHVEEEAHIGNFVETKKTHVGKGAKANHLAYLGDGEIGAGANVGAGTIFCNYDGFSKHTTVIEEGAFIGSDSQLVAPVRIGKGAYVATGTTITRDVPDDALAIGRTKQENKIGYASRLRSRLAANEKK